jgi:hypothetical protein
MSKIDITRQEYSPDTRSKPDQSVNDPHQVNPPGNQLLAALWPSTDHFHQIGTQNRQNKKFRNLPADGVADAVAQTQKLSSEGKEAFFACAEYLTPDNRLAANACGTCAFWMDIDCGEDKAAAGKGYATVEEAEDALRKFCHDAGLPKPTHIVHSGGGLHAYWALDGAVPREIWQSHARKLKGLTKACGFLADDSRTADIASILRVPGTLNHKYSPPRLVVLKYASAQFIEQAVMLDAISGTHVRLCGAAATKPHRHPSTAATTGNVDASKYGPPELGRLSSALAMLDPDCDEETWKLRCLAPLALEAHNHPDLSSALCELARSWSSGELRGKASKAWTTPGGNGLTGEEAFDAVWQRFLKDEYSGIPTTVGTVYYDAMQVGWDHEDQFQVVDVAVEGDA